MHSTQGFAQQIGMMIVMSGRAPWNQIAAQWLRQMTRDNPTNPAQHLQQMGKTQKFQHKQIELPQNINLCVFSDFSSVFLHNQKPLPCVAQWASLSEQHPNLTPLVLSKPTDQIREDKENLVQRLMSLANAKGVPEPWLSQTGKAWKGHEHHVLTSQIQNLVESLLVIGNHDHTLPTHATVTVGGRIWEHDTPGPLNILVTTMNAHGQTQNLHNKTLSEQITRSCRLTIEHLCESMGLTNMDTIAQTVNPDTGHITAENVFRFNLSGKHKDKSSHERLLLRKELPTTLVEKLRQTENANETC